MTVQEKCYRKSLACLESLRVAVREELEKKAKLGQMAVIADKFGKPMRVPAISLVGCK